MYNYASSVISDVVSRWVPTTDGMPTSILSWDDDIYHTDRQNGKW